MSEAGGVGQDCSVVRPSGAAELAVKLAEGEHN